MTPRLTEADIDPYLDLEAEITRLKKQMNEVNVLSTVTGAKHDTSSGVIHIPK